MSVRKPFEILNNLLFRNQDFQTCFKSWPKELIADHGIYVSEPLGGQLTQWARMYFEPDQLGEAI